MKIWPIGINSKLKRAFNKRQEEFHYRLASDPLTSEIRVRHLKNGSTVFARYSENLGTPYASDVFIFRPNMIIESKTYQYVRESNTPNSKPIGEIITKSFFKDNSYEPYSIATKSAWR